MLQVPDGGNNHCLNLLSYAVANAAQYMIGIFRILHAGILGRGSILLTHFQLRPPRSLSAGLLSSNFSAKPALLHRVALSQIQDFVFAVEHCEPVSPACQNPSGLQCNSHSSKSELSI